MTNEHNWEFTITTPEGTYTFTWKEYRNRNNQSLGYMGTVTTPDNQPVPHHITAAVKTAAATYRQHTLTNLPAEPYGGYDQKETFLNLFNRAQQGEYVGQENNGLYIQNVCTLLAINPWDIGTDIVNELIAEKQIGVYGMILIPYEQYAENFKNWEKKTGHKQLTMGDWGTWYCHTCGNQGDEQENPQDTPCQKTNQP